MILWRREAMTIFHISKFFQQNPHFDIAMNMRVLNSISIQRISTPVFFYLYSLIHFNIKTMIYLNSYLIKINSHINFRNYPCCFVYKILTKVESLF